MGVFQGSRVWGPLLTAMVTPFNADGGVDFAEAERLANFLVDNQNNSGIVVAGTTGESPTLSDSEKLELLRVVLSAVGNKAAVVFGAGTYDTNHSSHLCKLATDAGAHGIMLVSPYYSKPSQEGLYQHFKEVSNQTDLPVLIYNIQGRTAVNVETSTLKRLSDDVPNICAVKEASGNLAQISEVCTTMPEGFRVYSGDDILTLPVLSVGGIGVVSVAGHIIGKDIRKLIELFCSDGEVGSAIALNKKMIPLIQALFCTTNPTPIKYATALMGFRTSEYRLPIIPPNDAQKKQIENAMRAYGLLNTAAIAQ